MTDVDASIVARPTRYPPEVTRRVVEQLRAGSLETAPHATREPATVFTDPVQFQREAEQFFRRGAHVVGWEGELPQPNMFITKEVAGQPIVITRDGDGVLRGFRNACTHRGAQVAHGCGEARRLTCPYHAWSFDLGGNLVGQPEAWAFAEISRDTLGLIPVQVASVSGLLVVSLSDDVDPAAALADIAPQLTGYHYDTHEVVSTTSWTLAANWKLIVDVNLEAYHVPYLHRETLSSFVSNHSMFETYGRHARWAFPTFASEEMIDQPESEWPEPAPLTVVHMLFPSCVLLETPVSCQMLRIYPGRHVGECTVELTEASIAPVATEEERESRTRGAGFAAMILGQEDFPVAEQCQRGAEAGLTHFVFGAVEPMVQHWHTMWREALD
ncbi:MAG TPA: aromatic ring-hydroxylating dioxygenase subunit alpha [Ilumatobacteraceae bacterium]|jgi:phenylpropionate dioxygenase-like ring-hydroxylating dioxygenase large terminal subunit